MYSVVADMHMCMAGCLHSFRREMFDSFRDWYLTQGEFTHKKRMLLKDVRRKVAEVENRKQCVLHRSD